jgi:hypothetical protein
MCRSDSTRPLFIGFIIRSPEIRVVPAGPTFQRFRDAGGRTLVYSQRVFALACPYFFLAIVATEVNLIRREIVFFDHFGKGYPGNMCNLTVFLRFSHRID